MRIASSPWRLRLAPLAIALLLPACGSKGGDGYNLDVGSDDGGGTIILGPGAEAGASGFDAHIEQNHITVTFVTLSCTGPCANVVAVPTGGKAPYTFQWSDGSTSAPRQLCPTSSTKYDVRVTDTGTSGELATPAETVQVPLAANVVACADAGPDADGAPTVDASIPSGPPVYWATWSAPVTGSPGSAQGVIAPPEGDVQVTFTGEVGSGSAQTGSVTLSGVGPVYFLPATTYESATVPNAPPQSGMITIWGVPSLTQTITFSTPVQDALVALVALNETWVFGAPPTLLSSGPDALPVNVPGSYDAPMVSGDTVTGVDSSGVLEFPGTVTSITFAVPMSAAGDFTGFTVGMRSR